MRLEKYLISCGIASGKVIKKIIKNSEIIVNGLIENDPGRSIDLEIDIIQYKEKELVEKELKYYVLNKPAGYITAMSNPVNNRPIISDVLSKDIDWSGISPVGRLDKDTEGVLIFTNDGALNHELTYPEKNIDKEYYVELSKEISDEDLAKLETGVEIDNYISKPGKVKKITDKVIHLTIIEGRYHQVKKMLRAIGNRVVFLRRIRFAKIELGDLKLGEIREVHRNDIV